MNDAIRLASPDDHMVAPPNLWQDRLPAKYRENGPRVRREIGRSFQRFGWMEYEETPDGVPSDVWLYNDAKFPLLQVEAACGLDRAKVDANPTTYDEILLGGYDREARLQEMDSAGVEVSVCFPNFFVRFCGQQFLLAKDKELALECVKVYNDFTAEEWCAGSNGRLVGMSVLPLWDVELAVAELLRNAERGFRTFCFSEQPHLLGLPSIHSGYWDPLWAACNETKTVVSIHLGTGGLPAMAKDAPAAYAGTMSQMNMSNCLADWIFSGIFMKFPNLKLVLAESQAGWVPYWLHRADSVWTDQGNFNDMGVRLPRLPSEYFRDHAYVTFFKDEVALNMVDEIGVDNLMYEVDFPHTDSSWPTAAEYAQKITAHLDPTVAKKILRDNCLRVFGIEGSAT